jgi:hypothetical protein
MTTYLTKIEDGKTYHFRASVNDNGVEIVQGVFYHWLSKVYKKYDNHNSATENLQQLVREKLDEGYKLTDFEETPANTLQVYDKAKWHYDGDFPNELDVSHGFVHTGIF